MVNNESIPSPAWDTTVDRSLAAFPATRILSSLLFKNSHVAKNYVLLSVNMKS